MVVVEITTHDLKINSTSRTWHHRQSQVREQNHSDLSLFELGWVRKYSSRRGENGCKATFQNIRWEFDAHYGSGIYFWRLNFNPTHINRLKLLVRLCLRNMYAHSHSISILDIKLNFIFCQDKGQAETTYWIKNRKTQT